MRQEKEVRAEQVREAVRALYERNRQQGVAPWCGKAYDFVCPSMGTYPFQWFWDSCFHTIALSHFDLGRARSEVRGLLANQQPDGFIGHVTFWQREQYEEMLKTYSIAYRTPYISDCIQPPLIAEAAAAAAGREGRREFLAEVTPALIGYYDWLDRVRDPDQDGLIAILQPDESGLDHIPKYDAYLKIPEATHSELTEAWNRVTAPYVAVNRDPVKMFEVAVFVVEDVLVNTIYAENQRVLSELLAELGDDEGAARFSARAARTSDALIAKCWHEQRGLFFDLAGKDEQLLERSTVSSLMPILLPNLPKPMVEKLVAQLTDPTKYGARYPVPSTSIDDPAFEPNTVGGKLVWRGPSWINTNWYIARGLERHGHGALAEKIREASVDCVLQSGFREYYNPHTAEGHGANDFSWSALVIDMVAGR